MLEQNKRKTYYRNVHKKKIVNNTENKTTAETTTNAAKLKNKDGNESVLMHKYLDKVRNQTRALETKNE